ncbi:MAG: lysozyme [Afipia felis]|nr:lysozyme [Afipia felis]
MTLDQSLIDAVKGFEGFSPTASWDYKQYSNGYGTKTEDPGEKIDEATATQRLTAGLDGAAKAVDGVNPNLPQGVRNALISLTYNAGPGWINAGLGDAVRAGDYAAAKDKFLQYNKAGGKVNPGLVSRRAQESAWFDSSPGQSQTLPTQNIAQTSPAAPSGVTPAPPTSLAPPQHQPASDPMGALQGLRPSSLMAQMPASQISQPQPIFYAPRKQIDLSNLQAALHASGNRGLFFSKG